MFSNLYGRAKFLRMVRLTADHQFAFIHSYRSVRSAGGTRRVMRRRKRADGTYSAEHSYHSSEDEEGKARRRRRRRERRHGADSAHSYYRYAYYSTSCVV